MPVGRNTFDADIWRFVAALTLTFSLSNRFLRGFSLLQVLISRSY
jgi:hypothetical protein